MQLQDVLVYAGQFEVQEALAYVLQGVVMTVIGGTIYSAGKRGFWVNQSPRTKEFAQLVLVVALVGTGFLSSPVLNLARESVSSFAVAQQVGLLLIASRFGVNLFVDDWNFFDRRSVLIYLLGAAVALWPYLSPVVQSVR